MLARQPARHQRFSIAAIVFVLALTLRSTPELANEQHDDDDR